MAAPYAFVTLLTSDSYLPGALAQVAALCDLHPSPATPPEVDFQTVCLITPQTIDVSTIKVLRGAFNHVIGVEPILSDSDKELELLGEYLASSSIFTRSLSSPLLLFPLQRRTLILTEST
jgi:glycogenin